MRVAETIYITGLTLAFAAVASFTCFLRIATESMAPTLLAGDRLLVVRKSMLAGRFPARGQIVVFTAGAEGHKGRRTRRKLVKRVAAVGGDGIVAVAHAAKRDEGRPTRGGAFNGRPDKVPPGQVFVMGDNRRVSRDSRDYGCIDTRQVTGRVLLIVWPLRRVRVVR